MTAGIYTIKNTLNHKIYIGSAVDIRGRWGRHRFDLKRGIHTNENLQRSWNKYGQDNFEFHILCECEKEKLIPYEQIFIDGYNAVKEGFNMNPKAASSADRIVKDSTKKKLRDHFTGRKRNLSPEIRLSLAEKVRQAKIGVKRGPLSQKWRDNLSKSLTGKTNSEATKLKKSEAIKRYISIHGGVGATDPRRKKAMNG